MKCLCVCHSGRIRSGAMVVAMRFRGWETMQMGVGANSPETLVMGYEWADLVACATDEIREKMIDLITESEGAAPDRARFINLDLGPDVWRTKTDNNLLKLVRKRIHKLHIPKVGDPVEIQ